MNYVCRVYLRLDTEIDKPFLGDELVPFKDTLFSLLDIEPDNPLISVIPGDPWAHIVLIFLSREIPHTERARGALLSMGHRRMRIVDTRTQITELSVAKEESEGWSERCASLELVTPYPFDGPSIPPIRGVLGSALDVWKSYTGEELRLGRAKVLRQDLKVIKTKEWRGLVGTLTVKGRGAGTAAYIAGLVGLGKWRSKGFGLANFLGDKGCERFERSENR